MVFRVWKKMDDLSTTIKSLWAVVGMLVLITIFMALCLATVPNRLRIYIPPDLSHGVTTRVGVIPKATVYAFAFQIFTAVNTWSDSGDEDYQKNIHAYKNYLSSAFYQQFEDDYLNRKGTGALSRKRMVTGVSSMGYKPKDVTQLGNGSWLVNMKLQVVETLDGSVIKDVIMDYPLIVSTVNASIAVNPWGLQIAGYEKQPYRVKTII